MLKTNLPNQIRQMPLPKWRPMLPVFEATMNAFQAIREAQRPAGTGEIAIAVDREANLVDKETAPVIAFTITDNGIGFTDENFDSFNTLYSDYKLKHGGKGLGRFTWLKAFERVEIDTVFKEKEGYFHRKFLFDENYETERGDATPSTRTKVGTTVRLVGFKDPYRSQFPRTTDQFIQRLVEHFLLIFLEPHCPAVHVHDGLSHSANDVFTKDFKTTASRKSFKIKDTPFTFFGFRLTTPKASKHKLVYAANQRGVVSDDLEDYLPNLSGRLPSPDGNNFVYLGIVQSPYLNKHVNPGRTDFDIGIAQDAEMDQQAMFVDEIARGDIRNECINHIQQDLAGVIQSINNAKAEKIRSYVDSEAPQYKILMKHLDEFVNRLTANPTRAEIELVLHQEIHLREVKLKQEGTRIIREADKSGADFEEIEQQLNDFMENYNELGVSTLARYVAQRKILLDFLERAISKREDTQRYPLEKVVHQLIFPRHKTSEDVASNEQNLWMIDERLAYHTFISSDKPLSSLKRVLSATSRKEPDIFLFDRKIIFGENEQPINSIITVEFKRPMRDDYTPNDNPLLQSMELIEAIRAGKFLDPKTGRNISVANDKIPAFCYIICDITATLKRVLKTFQALPTPDNQGYYGFHRDYGVYYEVTDYTKLLRDAKQRNRIFFDKLNILGNR
jgi:hypothetical protein